MRIAAIGCLSMLILAPVAASAETRAIVIGIDDYQNVPPLHGAVNDARDIADALNRIGIADLTVLLDGEASRARILAAWDGVLSRAVAGDQIILSYAGHGAQEPEHVAGSETDGKDEVLLLAGFASNGPGTRERLIDDEIGAWFAAAAAKNVEVVFVADACHSGTLTRAVATDVNATYRLAPDYTIDDDELTLDANSVQDGNENAAANVTYLGAAQDNEKVPEVMLPDGAGNRVSRGALSYLFARALDGQADADSDGIVSRTELFDFVRENARLLSDSRQTPNLLSEVPERGVVLSKVGDDHSIPLEAASGPVMVALAGSAMPQAENTLRDIDGVVPSTGESSPDVIWDPDNGRLFSGSGDLLADAVTNETLPHYLAKVRAVRQLSALARLHTMKARLRPDDQVHHQHETVALELADPPYPYVTLFDLANDGTLFQLFPRAGEDSDWSEREDGIAFAAAPPFGADHLVGIATPQPMPDLIGKLAGLDGEYAADQVVELMTRALQGRDYAMVLQASFTAP
jgi:hypothetical protein